MLPTRVVDLPLTGGYDQAKDAVAVQAGSFIKLENLEYDAAGALWKRHGSSALPTDTTDGLTLPAIQRLDTLGPELLAIGTRANGGGDTLGEPGAYLWSYSSEQRQWSPRSSVSPCTFGRRPVLRSSLTLSASQPFVAYANGKEIWVWRGPAGGGRAAPTLFYRIRDNTTGAILVDDTSLGVDADKFVAFACGDVVAVVWFDGVTNFREIRIDTTSLSLSSVLLGPATVGGVAVAWDACKIDDSTYAIVFTDGNTYLVRVALGVGQTHLHTVAGVEMGIPAVWSDGAKVGIAYSHAGGVSVDCYRAATLAAVFVGTLAMDTSDPTQPAFYDRLAGCFDGLGTAAWVLADARLENSLTNKDDGLWGIAVDATSGALVNTLRHSYHLSLCSRPWAYGSSVWVLAGPSTVNDPSSSQFVSQFGVALLNLTAHSSSSTRLPHLVGGLPALDTFHAYVGIVHAPPLPYVVSTGGAGFLSVLELYASYNVVDAPPRAFDALIIDFTQPQAGLWGSASAQGSLCQTGALTGWYDGYSATELGFLQRPRWSRADNYELIGGTGGASGSFRYSYIAVYAWRDGRGNLHLSEPSDPLVVDLTDTIIAEDGGVSVRLFVKTTHATRKGDNDDGSSRQSLVWIYRTAANAPETYYLCDCVDLENSLSEYDVTFVDVETDEQLILVARGILYTAGGIIENRPPPPSSAVLEHKGRLWLASANDSKEIFFSKLLVSGEGPGFSEAFRLRIDDSPEGITGLAALDDKVIVFASRRIYAITGDGPNDKGGDGSFGGPFLVTSSAGCIDARSIVSWSGGVFFQSAEGLVLLDRGLGLTHAGAPVQDLTASYPTITGGVCDAARQRCLWLLSGGSRGLVLIFDYERNAWLSWTYSALRPQKSQVIWNGDHVRSAYTGSLYSSAVDPGRDGEDWITMRLQLPHLRVDALGGAERVRRFIVSGQRLRGRTLYGRTYFDQAVDFDQELTLAEDHFSGSGTNRFLMHLSRQKGSTVSFELEDEDAWVAIEAGEPAPAGVRCRIFGIAAEVGALPGVARLNSGDRR